MTEAKFREYIQDTILAEFQTQKEAADAWGFSPQYITDVLKGRRHIGDRLIEALGFERITDIQPKEKPHA